MHFAASGVTVSPWVPPAVGFALSFLCSAGGVSGAFLLLPFQMSVLGFTSPAVSATNQLYNVVAIPSGVWRYFREGRMVWPLAAVVVAGTLPGVFAGALVRIRYLPDSRAFTVFAGVVLAYIGLKMAWDLLRKQGGGDASEARFERLMAARRRKGGSRGALPAVTVLEAGPRRVEYEFLGERCSFSTPGVLALSCAVGLVGGTYGIGGGAILAPFFVTFFRLPVYTVAGPALLGTFLTSVFGVGFYQLLAPFFPGVSVAPDWGLGLLFGAGGAVGMYCGARVQKFLPARLIKGLLAVLVLLLALKYCASWIR